MTRQPDVQVERQDHAAEIISRLKAHAPEILAHFPVDMAYLHGSVAHGRPLPSSDVDIALVLTELPPPYERLTLEFKIQAALEDACDLTNLDVRTINEAPLMVKGSIIQEGLLLYSRDKDRRLAFEILTRKKYFDYQPTAARMQQAFLSYIRRKGLSGGQSKDAHIHPK
jgi:predicted nucleotidyltransferase